MFGFRRLAEALPMLYFAAVLLASFPALPLGINIFSAHARGQHNMSGQLEPPAGRRAIAHVTQGEPGSLWGIFAMHSQLKKFKSNAEHVVLVSEDAPDTYASLLERIGVQAIKYNPREISEPLQVCTGCWAGTFQKIIALKQTQFSSLVVVDYDVHAMGNFDHVFSYEAPAMATWCQNYADISTCTPNSGVFVTKPSEQLFQKLVSSLSQLGPGGELKQCIKFESCESYSDQSFLRNFFYKGYAPDGKNITELPRLFNARSASIDKIMGETREQGQEVKLIHFTLHKPYRDGKRILADVAEGSALAQILCEAAHAVQATLDANPGMITSFGQYDSFLASWEELAHDKNFAEWARHHCKNLPLLSA